MELCCKPVFPEEYREGACYLTFWPSINVLLDIVLLEPHCVFAWWILSHKLFFADILTLTLQLFLSYQKVSTVELRTLTFFLVEFCTKPSRPFFQRMVTQLILLKRPRVKSPFLAGSEGKPRFCWASAVVPLTPGVTTQERELLCSFLASWAGSH